MKHVKRIAVAIFLVLTFSPALPAPHASLLNQIQAEQVAIIERARAFVVSISVTQISDGKGNLLSGNQRGGGTGSGAIITKSGWIITNKHVVDGEDLIRQTGTRAELIYSYKVTLSNKKVYDAELIRPPGDIDLAILKIKNPPPDLEPAVIGDSDQLRAGQVVFAIGSPFGFSDSVSMGIISNVARRSIEMSKYHSFIQTDAAINPGNSGGPLIDIDAKVIGINTMIYSKSGESNGLGFAIPSKVVNEFIAGVKSSPRASGWIGILVESIDAQMRAMFSISPSIDGLWVSTIEPKSPGFGKVKLGDIIQAIDGEKVLSPEDWKRVVLLKGEGTTVKLSLIRKGKSIQVSIVLGKLPG